MRKQVTLLLALGLAGLSATAQQALRVAPGKAGMYPESLLFAPGHEPDFVRGSVLLKKEDAYVRSTDAIFRHSEKDQLGQEHFRYQQKINDIPVEGATYVVHVAAGKIKSENGEWLATPSADMPVAPSISGADALRTAMKAFGAKSYKWQLPDEEAFIKAESGDATATFQPKAELVYYSGEQSVDAANMRLAYKLDLYAHQPIGRRIYFIDAETGAVLGIREVMHTANVTGTATTAFSGSQSITTDSTGAGAYRLRETARGGGIQTFNLGTGTNYSTATDFTDSDNAWNNTNTALDQYATDAHWGAEMTYDYFKNSFNRNSINNSGFAIKSYVHYSTNYFNAFWDGSRMTYGDGSSLNGYKPLTALDVCGHEITHGLTSFTANLNYSYESGALNEGFSDIFGTTIEFYAKGSSANWLIGEAFYTLRSMSNPNAYGHPDTYQGTNWATGTADNGGVHTNSSVLNFWYYLLTQGGSGTNDKGTAYSVTGIGLSKAAAIAYRTLTVYLTATSNYTNARTYSIQAATDLYGASSAEVTQTTNAWIAVGVANTAPQTCSDSYEANESRTASKTIAINTDISAKIGTSTDKDWFKFTTTSSAPKLKVTLTNLPYDYDMRLYNSSGTQLAAAQASGIVAESISYNSSSSGATYYVQVYGYNNQYSTTGCYKLRASTSSVNQLVDDEDNNQINGITKNSGSGSMGSDDVSVYPNPAKDRLAVRFSAEEDGLKLISVTDLVGRIVSRQEVAVQAGANKADLSLSGYRAGIYFLTVAGKPSIRFVIAE